MMLSMLANNAKVPVQMLMMLKVTLHTQGSQQLQTFTPNNNMTSKGSKYRIFTLSYTLNTKTSTKA